MSPVNVAIINNSQVLKDDEIAAVVPALQTQVSKHLAPKWSIDATLQFVPSGKNAPADSWRLEIWDDTDQPPDAGYHTVGAEMIPYGKVFVNTVKKYTNNWTITASHELLEMLVNPYAMLPAYISLNDTAGFFVNLEVCDPVSPDVNGYQIDDVWVSDFVFPEWFSPYLADHSQSHQVDYCSRLDAPAPAIVPDTSVALFGWRVLQSQPAAAPGPAGKDIASALRQKASALA